MPLRGLLSAIALLAVLSVAAGAQDSSPVRDDAARLAEGWALLARGDAGGAALVASQMLARDRLSTAALALAIDADLYRAGASTALSTYERWLDSRRVDDPYVIRRIARVMLAEASRKQPNAGARLEALQALAADGDPAATSALEAAASSNGFGETRALASLGNEQAVTRLIGQLQAMPGGKTALIDALGDSGSKQAVPQLKALLSDPTDLNRAAAADALGRLGATDAVPQLKLLLKDQNFTVRLKAAGALFRLNDSSGQPLLTDLAGSEHAGIRVAAARELAPQPDAAWQSLVRSLAHDPDPSVRLEAARLVAPYDLALAESVLSMLMRDSNIGIREAASAVMVQRVASDFPTLRTLLQSEDTAVRVKAAARILELTR